MLTKKINLPFPFAELKAGKSQKAKNVRKNQEQPSRHINPRIRAYGKARLDILQRIQTQEDWDTLWKDSTYSFPFAFSWGAPWKYCVEYRVYDFAAEIGFWIDIMGMNVNEFGQNYAQFSSPGGEFSIAVIGEEDPSFCTPPGTIRLQFHVDKLSPTSAELSRRGIEFDDMNQTSTEDSSLSSSTYHTPHGIPIEIWGEIDQLVEDKDIDRNHPPVQGIRNTGSIDFEDDFRTSKIGIGSNDYFEQTAASTFIIDEDINPLINPKKDEHPLGTKESVKKAEVSEFKIEDNTYGFNLDSTDDAENFLTTENEDFNEPFTYEPISDDEDETESSHQNPKNFYTPKSFYNR